MASLGHSDIGQHSQTTLWAPRHPRTGVDPTQLWHSWLLADSFFLGIFRHGVGGCWPEFYTSTHGGIYYISYCVYCIMYYIVIFIISFPYWLNKSNNSGSRQMVIFIIYTHHFIPCLHVCFTFMMSYQSFMFAIHHVPYKMKVYMAEKNGRRVLLLNLLLNVLLGINIFTSTCWKQRQETEGHGEIFLSNKVLFLSCFVAWSAEWTP